MIRVLFVCLGNICRSPTAHGVFVKKTEEHGLQGQVDVDSAGTAAYHCGEAPDARASAAAARRGYDLSELRARQAVAEDFYTFDYVLAMDHANLINLQALCPSDAPTRPQLFLQTYGRRFQESEVPDPYYGGSDGFEHVLDLVEDACEGLLADIQARLERAQ
ncbi:MAG: phosphotyrosine protein phosphatase [Oceanospirillaceae bacterium]|nr:phosphotyrosine protein phosphatase [Oceanospirillaceae bacterium]MBT12640.1 phosphotyrosine protein phosphatase [Oceanospirillaceae bacterium]|tara:strand:- start:6784 stop:7269 length:486 start_codon:yes stop_codon:yes gene_type:complete